MNKYLKKILILSLLSCSLVGCGLNTNNNNTPDVTTTPTEPVITCSFCANLPTAEKIIYSDLTPHIPTTFKADTVEISNVKIKNGVMQNTYTFIKNNGKLCKVVVTEVDLSKAYIAAGTTDNSFISTTKSTPISQALAFQNANEKVNVLAAVNADFFGGDSPVNAFVKESVIIKNSHNDKGIYDYTNLNADLPASMPMLFGVSGETAQIAPMIKNGSVKETIQAKLSYEVMFKNETKTTTLSEGITFNNADGSDTLINILTDEDGLGTALPGSKVLSIKKHSTKSTRLHGEIESVTDILGNSLYRANEDYFYIIIPDGSSFNEYEIGDLVSYNITSPDETWKYYDTIIGCRQALVINGEIPNTVAKENSNGAQSTNIPRTAVGIKPDGKVVVFSVEALRYKSSNKVTDSDPYGLNLPQLADFMRYYGVYSGANFDGGGSTQLITRSGFNGTGDFEVIVRSSDYGTYTVSQTRVVINTLLITTKKSKLLG